MTIQDINDIIKAVCPNDEDYEKPCISPKYLKQELEQLALEQEPILDKIRAEIENKYGHCDICECFEDYDYEEHDISEYRPIGDIADILQIIDKYKEI